MNNNKGQALVEFVIILPILLIIILSIVDFGNIIIKKYSLENDVDVISDLYREKKFDDINAYVNNKNIKLNYSSNSDLFIINVSKEVDIMSPILILPLGKTYNINIEKSVYRE